MSDSLYGMEPDKSEDFGVNLGAISPRGERGVLIVDLDALIPEVVADSDFEARGRNRFVRIIASEPCSVNGNRELVRSAIENVIRNAVTYTDENTEVEVSLSCSENRSEKQATVRVHDHGRGVPIELLRDIFIPFYRVADARERSTGAVSDYQSPNVPCTCTAAM